MRDFKTASLWNRKTIGFYADRPSRSRRAVETDGNWRLSRVTNHLPSSRADPDNHVLDADNSCLPANPQFPKKTLILDRFRRPNGGAVLLCEFPHFKGHIVLAISDCANPSQRMRSNLHPRLDF
jgi:hypothetical protein